MEFTCEANTGDLYRSYIYQRLKWHDHMLCVLNKACLGNSNRGVRTQRLIMSPARLVHTGETRTRYGAPYHKSVHHASYVAKCATYGGFKGYRCDGVVR